MTALGLLEQDGGARCFETDATPSCVAHLWRRDGFHKFRLHYSTAVLHWRFRMDQFQFFFRDHPAGPVRGTWQEAAQDAVAAGLADWVHENPHRAINWAIRSEERRVGKE